MPKKIGSYIITDEIIEKMKHKVKDSIKIDRELGFVFCKDPKSNILKDREECEGEKCQIWSIKPETMCKKGEELVGLFHSHGINMPDPSMADLGYAYQTGFGCIGGTIKGETSIKCDVRNGRYNREKSTEITRNVFLEQEQIQKIMELESPMRENIKRTLKERFTTIDLLQQ